MASLQLFNSSSSSTSPHLVLFPFMSKGHTIPILHLARLLLRRNITITILTTPLNSPFICKFLSNYINNNNTNNKNNQLTIINLPFPKNLQEIPDGIESTDKLPSISLFLPFATATKLMKPHFEEALKTIPNPNPITCIISDGFLGWTVDSAAMIGVPRLVFYGMSNYAMVMSRVVVRDRLLDGVESDDEPFTVPTFPWIKLTRNDLEHPFNDPDSKGPMIDFILEQAIATANSKGMIMNSFYELEPVFLDYMNKEWKPKCWCVGPLCLSLELTETVAAAVATPEKHQKWWVQWLDEKLEKGESVLYVSFGTQAEMTEEQLREVAAGLERSQVSFMWVLRPEMGGSGAAVPGDEFEERVKERGLVVREWVEQVEVLRHESVHGFMSHCGWNSVVESLCAGVPVVAWPMMAEQHLNARMVEEELGIGVRVLSENGSVRGFVRSEMVEKMVKELMEGESGKKARKKVKELGKLARKAMEEGGSSYRTLNALIEELCGKN